MTVASSQTITDDLRRWIADQLDAGCQADDVVAAMCASGWQAGVARDALAATLKRLQAEPAGVAAVAELPARPAAKALPEPTLDGAPTLLQAQGHALHVQMAMRQPRVIVFAGLLSDEECDDLVALARPRLVRSETVDNSTGGSEVNAARTSSGMFFERGETALIGRIEQRIAALLNWPLDHGEGLQVLHYLPGAEYRPHHDYFDPQHPGSATILRRGGQRVATLVMYLNTPQGGGATTFPDVGLEVAPVKGSAVFFSYDRPDASTLTLHGGAPVLGGEKWVATKWLREGVFT